MKDVLAGGEFANMLTFQSCSMPQQHLLRQSIAATAAPAKPPGSPLASLAVDEDGREVIVLNLEGSRDQVSAKQLIVRLSEEFGLSLDVPWNFIPEQLVLYSKKK